MFILACEEAKQMCCNIFPFLKIVKLLIAVIQFSVPLVLIILGTIDMFKVVTSGDSKVSEETGKNFFKRLIYAVIIFLVPFLLQLILTVLVDNILPNGLEDDFTGPLTWLACWNKVELTENNYCSECDIYSDNSQTSGNQDYVQNENQGEIVDEVEENLNNLTKTCYVYKKNQLSCQDGYYLYNNSCHIVMPNSSSRGCQGSDYLWIDNRCLNLKSTFEPIISVGEIASATKPTKSFDGIVKIYSCPISVSSCGDYSSCTYQQDLSVDSE